MTMRWSVWDLEFPESPRRCRSGWRKRGREGVDLALELIRCLVMDLVMPELDGVQATLGAQKNGPEAKIFGFD